VPAHPARRVAGHGASSVISLMASRNEVWNGHPYLGLLLCSAVGGTFAFGAVRALIDGSYLWGRGPRATLIAMITSAIPVIAVSDSVRAEDYYCRVLGFQKVSAYPPDAAKPDPRYLGLARDGVWVHLQSYKPQRAGMTDAFFWVTDVDPLYEEFSARGAASPTASDRSNLGNSQDGHSRSGRKRARLRHKTSETESGLTQGNCMLNSPAENSVNVKMRPR
jgi:hypothetical protein